MNSSLKRRIRILVGILILLLVGVIFGGIFIKTPTPDLQKWDIYLNKKYGYSIAYPLEHISISETESGSVVSFFDESSYLLIGVEVKDLTPNFSFEKWLEENLNWKFEKRIETADYDAIITHYLSNEGEFPEEKLSVFISRGKLFTILTRHTAHDRILNSFKFE